MQHRVACLNPSCGAHRDRALDHTERCFVCGCGLYTDVPLNLADIDDQIHECTEDLDGLYRLRTALLLQPPPVTH